MDLTSTFPRAEAEVIFKKRRRCPGGCVPSGGRRSYLGPAAPPPRCRPAAVRGQPAALRPPPPRAALRAVAQRGSAGSSACAPVPPAPGPAAAARRGGGSAPSGGGARRFPFSFAGRPPEAAGLRQVRPGPRRGREAPQVREGRDRSRASGARAGRPPPSPAAVPRGRGGGGAALRGPGAACGPGPAGRSAAGWAVPGGLWPRPLHLSPRAPARPGGAGSRPRTAAAGARRLVLCKLQPRTLPSSWRRWSSGASPLSGQVHRALVFHVCYR